MRSLEETNENENLNVNTHVKALVEQLHVNGNSPVQLCHLNDNTQWQFGC
jgi:hypothetical protein